MSPSAFNPLWNLSRVSKLIRTDYFKAFSILVAAYLYISYLKSADRPIVTTSNGKLKGVISFSRSYHRYHAYLGVPYAQPPVGDLRFEAPRPIQDWRGIRDAGYYRSQCISLELFFIGGVLFGEEDCLFLNVFSPSVEKSKTGKKLPVMVFFHGGLFHFGSPEDHGEKYFMDEEVVLVTVTYRLGALGFLSTGDNLLRGNQGLKDQTMALQWIRKNIQHFGGDSSKVTIFGESAGGFAVGLHLLSPLSQGLFHKAIVQSGALHSPWGHMRQVEAQAKRFASKFNCPTDDNKEMVRCLKQVDAKTLVYAHMEGIDFFRTKPMIFAPTIESVNDSGAFMVEDPLKILESGKWPKIPMIMGINADEGMLYTTPLAKNSTKLALMSQFELSLPVTLQYAPIERVTQEIQSFYFDKTHNGTREEYLTSLKHLFGDRHFYQPIAQTASIYSKHAPLYLYYYNFTGFHSMEHFLSDRESTLATYVHPILSLFVRHTWRVIQEFLLGMPVFGKGVCHGSELPLQFNHPWTPSFYSNLPERDVQMSKDFVKLWVSFATTSDHLMLGKTRWESVQPDKPREYLEIGKNPRMIREPFTERVTFWESIIDQLQEPEVT